MSAETQQTKGSLRQNCPETSIEPRPLLDVLMVFFFLGKMFARMFKGHFIFVDFVSYCLSFSHLVWLGRFLLIGLKWWRTWTQFRWELNLGCLDADFWSVSSTPPKTNMEPKNWWFVDVSPFPRNIFRFHVSFQGGMQFVYFILKTSLVEWHATYSTGATNFGMA